MPEVAALDVLNNLNGEIQIGLVIGNTVAPIIIAAVKDVKAWINSAGEIEFNLAVTQGQSALSASVADFLASLTEINAERAKDGLPPITVPGS